MNRANTHRMLAALEGYFRPAKPTLAQAYTNQDDAHAVVHTCIDSRCQPTLVLNLEPGEMFRSTAVGATIPKYGTDIALHAETNIGFPLKRFENVKNIIVMGHSDCGAMKALYEALSENIDLDTKENPELRMILSAFEGKDPLLNTLREAIQTAKAQNLPKEQIFEQLSQIMVIQSMQNLMDYPLQEGVTIGDKIKSGELYMVGCMSGITKSQTSNHFPVQVYDPEQQTFHDIYDLRHDTSHVTCDNNIVMAPGANAETVATLTREQLSAGILQRIAAINTPEAHHVRRA